MERVRTASNEFVSKISSSVDSMVGLPDSKNTKRIDTSARFLSNDVLETLDGRRVRARRSVVIATGSSPIRPPELVNRVQDRLVTSDEVLGSWTSLPQSIAIFGPGPVGLELAQALHRLDVCTYIFGRGGSRLGPLTDPELIEKATEVFRNEFFLHADAMISSIERTSSNDGVTIKFEDPNGVKRCETVQYVLAAVGRKANVDELGLEATSLHLNELGVPYFNPYTMQCITQHYHSRKSRNNVGIFIAGDVNLDRPLYHEAVDEGNIAGHNAALHLTDKSYSQLRKSPLNILFTDPGMAVVGSSFRQLKHSHCNFVDGVANFANHERSVIQGENYGLLKVYAEIPSGRLMGAEMVCPSAEHIAQLLAWAHQQQMSIQDLLNMPLYHPAAEEVLQTALRQARSRIDIAGIASKHHYL